MLGRRRAKDEELGEEGKEIAELGRIATGKMEEVEAAVRALRRTITGRDDKKPILVADSEQLRGMEADRVPA